jgi:hypothetical protein
MRHQSCERCAFKVLEQEWDGYSVSMALAILRVSPRPFVLLQPKDLVLSYIRNSVAGTTDHVPHVDARRPCIVVPFGSGFKVIDGNHRAAKQLRRGAAVRAYVLTKQEAERTREAL